MFRRVRKSLSQLDFRNSIEIDQAAIIVIIESKNSGSASSWLADYS